MEAMSSARFVQCVTVEQACWLEELQNLTGFGFVINSIENILNIFMRPTERPNLYFHYLLDISNFC